MYVNNLMVSKENLITVSREDTADLALALINENNFLSIPVIEENKFYGAISKESIFAHFYKMFNEKNMQISLKDFKVKDVMLTDFPTVSTSNLIENAADLLYKNNVPFLAVEENNDFKGIITHKAIFKEFTEIFGFNKGKRIAVIAYDIPGQISKLTKIITENKGDIISCVVSDPKSLMAVKEIVIRLEADNYELIQEKIANNGFKII